MAIATPFGSVHLLESMTAMCMSVTFALPISIERRIRPRVGSTPASNTC